MTEGTEYNPETAVYATTVKVQNDAATPEYSLKQKSELFQIDTVIGEVVFKRATTPDHESGKISYTFTIVATVNDAVDGGKISAEHNVTLWVKDINDNAPEFNSPAIANLEDGKEYRSTKDARYDATTDDVYKARATPDVESDKVVWSLEAGDDVFDIAPNTGVVTFAESVKVDADADGATTSYQFTVRATVTSGGLTQTADRVVTLNVLDGNDEKPKFNSPAVANLEDGKEYRSRKDARYDATTDDVYKATATPDVAETKVVYSLSAGQNVFEINEKTGAVTFKSTTEADADGKTPSYVLTVRATVNYGGKTQTADHVVTLNIPDIRDEKPVFTSSNSGTVADERTYPASGNVTPNDVVYVALAKPDVETDPVFYRLKNNGSTDDNGLFAIDDSTGAVIFVAEHTLDYKNKDSYSFTVTATVTVGELVETSELAVTVRVVVDLDDNEGVYLLNGPDGQTHPDGRVHAIDANQGSDAIIKALETAEISKISSQLADATTVFGKDIIKHYPTGVLNPIASPTVRDDGRKIWAVFTGADDKTGMAGDHIINLFLARAGENSYTGAATQSEVFYGSQSGELPNITTAIGVSNILSYTYAPAGVEIALALNKQADPKSGERASWAHGDAITNIGYIVGSEHIDTLTGDDGDNVFEGGVRADSIDGGDGHDTASYANSAESVTVSLLGNTASDGDTLTNIENLIGSAHNDELTGDDANSGNIIEGGAGGDRIDGRGGRGPDLASYVSSPVGVTIDLSATDDLTGLLVVSGNENGHAQGDTLSGIEGLIGSVYQDVFTAHDSGSWLYGMAGDDTLQGGIGDDNLSGGMGADGLNGGEGDDTAAYKNVAAVVAYAIEVPTNDLLLRPLNPAEVITVSEVTGVYVNLHYTTAQSSGTSEATGDRLSNIENLDGSLHNDVLVGNREANTLNGYAGDDYIFGGWDHDIINAGDGNDFIDGGHGGDRIDGGDGIDTVSYETSPFLVKVSLHFFDNNPEYLAAGGFAGGRAPRDEDPENSLYGDRLVNVENLIGSDYSNDGPEVHFYLRADTLMGNAKDNDIDGRGGSDALVGDGGNDTIWGRSGHDRIWGGTGNDKIYGGAGNDTLFGDQGNDQIKGGAGNDLLSGFEGNNTLTGGEGADKFVINLRIVLYGHTSTVMDFDSTQGDMITIATGNLPLGTQGEDENTLSYYGLKVVDNGNHANIVSAVNNQVAMIIQNIDHNLLSNASTFNDYFEVVETVEVDQFSLEVS